MYFRVYAPNGEPFDVPRELADKLILQDGWTQSPASTEWLDSIKATAPVEKTPVAEIVEPEVTPPVQAKETTPVKGE